MWFENEQGLWCPSCGDRVAPTSDKVVTEPEECRQCGFPDAEAVADYHCGPDDDDEPAEFEFDCGRGPDGYCALAGTEDCDWDCPHS